MKLMDDVTAATPGRRDVGVSASANGTNLETMPLHAEIVDFGKRRVDELVTVTRTTQTKTVLVDETLETNGVVIEHVAIGEYIDAIPPVRVEGDTTILSVVEEVAVVVKRLMLREEIRITQIRTTSQHVETVMVREQHAHVTRAPLAGRTDGERALPKQTQSQGIPSMDNEETIVAVYDTPAHAELAVGDLLQANVPESAISRHAGTSTSTETAPVREQGFWASLLGGEATDEHVYERSAQSGSSVVVVKTPMRDVDAVMEILERHSPINIDERAASYGAGMAATTSGAMGASTMTNAAVTAPVTTGYADAVVSATGTGDTMQLSEEQLLVGKRLVNRGGTRLRRYVVETPVQEDVSLHSETVRVERRPVSGGTTATPDFSEKIIEMTASTEEAVVSKTAHVVEEVSLRKEASDRVETVHDTVRKEEVEVEQIPGQTGVETATAGALPIPGIPRK